MPDFKNIDASWTLFLDRDGVINKKLEGDYVKSVAEFEFLPGAKEAIVGFSKVFGRIIIVTNQQGVGKGLMSDLDLQSVHQYLLDEVKKVGGHIDAVYYAPQLATENSEMRKPKVGMAIKAKEEFLDVDFDKSIMVGDSISDMQFGENAKMMTIFISASKSSEYFSIPSIKALNELIS